MEGWGVADAYERYMGRWSRQVAHGFLRWLGAPPDRSWLDVGCGSGALIEAVARCSRPRRLAAVDPSPGFAVHVAARLPGTACAVARAEALPLTDGSFEVVVAGPVLNFADTGAALAEMRRTARSLVAAYVWNYGGRMELLQAFWPVAAELDPAAVRLDEARRFGASGRAEALAAAFVAAGLREVEVEPVEITMAFRDLDDCWSPFLGGRGPAPAYCATLDEEGRRALRRRLGETLPVGRDGSIRLAARAWAPASCAGPAEVGR